MRTPILIGGLLLLASCGAAWADDCGTLKQVSTVDLITLGPGGRVAVPVLINNVPKKLLLATAGGISSLSAAAVASLNLHPTEAGFKLLSTNGNVSRQYVHFDSMQIGQIGGQNMDLMVSVNPSVPGTDGELTTDLLTHYDVELDFAAGKMNFFSPDHCAGRVVYWPAQPVAIVPFSQIRPQPLSMNQRIPFNDRDSHIRVSVTLDGKPFSAVINTGTPNSTMIDTVAKREFGVTRDSPGSVPVGTGTAFGHVFSSLAFEGITISNPHIVITQNLTGAKDPNNNPVTGSLTDRVDDNLASEVTIGMDVLKRLHIYIAYRESKLYITPASPPADAPK
jgi:predicted aspartyl protease